MSTRAPRPRIRPRRGGELGTGSVRTCMSLAIALSVALPGYAAGHGASIVLPAGAGARWAGPIGYPSTPSVQASWEAPAAVTRGAALLPAGSNDSPYPEAGTVLATLREPGGPYGVAFNPADGRTYVTNRLQGTVSAWNGTQLVGTVRVGALPVGAVLNPSNGFLYVTNYGSNNVALLRGLTLVGWINDSSFSGPFWPAYDARSGTIYVPNMNGASVTVLNGTAVVTTLAAGTGPVAATYDAQNGFVYVTSGAAAAVGGSNVSVFDGLTPVATLSGNFTNPWGATYDPRNGYVYVANKNISNRGGGYVTVLNGLSVVAKVGAGPELWGATYNPTNGYVYATANDIDESTPTLHANSLVVINGTRLLQYIPVRVDPYAAAVNAAHALLYVADGGSDNLSVASTALSIGPMSATPIGSPPGSADVGQTVGFVAPLLANGTGVGTVAWSWSGTGKLDCGVIGPPLSRPLTSLYRLQCNATVAGALSIGLNVTDGTAHTVRTHASITLFAPPKVSTPIPSRGAVDVAQRLNFTATLSSAGSMGDTFQWNNSAELSCATPATLTLDCTSIGAGVAESATLTVTDSNGASSTARSVNVSAYSDPVVPPPTFSAPTVPSGGTVVVTAHPSGGYGGFDYLWAGLPVGCSGSSASLTCRTSTPGTFLVSVTVTDANGFAARSGGALLNVTGPSASPGLTVLGLPALVFFGALAAIIAAAALATAFAVRRSARSPRRRPITHSDEPPPTRMDGPR